MTAKTLCKIPPYCVECRAGYLYSVWSSFSSPSIFRIIKTREIRIEFWWGKLGIPRRGLGYNIKTELK